MRREQAQIIDFSRQLIRVPSTADNAGARSRVLDMASEQLSGFPSKEFVSNGVKSRLFYNMPDFPGRFRVILNGHLDVVPQQKGDPDLFVPHESNGRLYGRGSGDMKAAVAVQMEVFKELADKVNFPLGLMLVTDEEVGGADGTGYQVSQGVRTDFAIMGEPTNLGICHAMKGRLGLHVVTNSEATHAAYPGRVDASPDEAAAFMVGLRELYPKPPKDNWQTTAAITNFGTTTQEDESDTVPNTIPAGAFVKVDVRYIPDESAESVLTRLDAIAGSHTGIEVVQSIPSAYTDPKNPDILGLQNAIRQATGSEPAFARQHGSCDFRYFTAVGDSGVAFGPTANRTHHTAGEYVEIESLFQYQVILEQFLLNVNR